MLKRKVIFLLVIGCVVCCSVGGYAEGNVLPRDRRFRIGTPSNSIVCFVENKVAYNQDEPWGWGKLLKSDVLDVSAPTSGSKSFFWGIEFKYSDENLLVVEWTTETENSHFSGGGDRMVKGGLSYELPYEINSTRIGAVQRYRIPAYVLNGNGLFFDVYVADKVEELRNCKELGKLYFEIRKEVRDQYGTRFLKTPDPVRVPMVSIERGRNIGTDPDFGPYELSVENFQISTTEISREQWDDVYAWALENGYSFNTVGFAKGEKYPIEGITWRDCIKWCNAYSEKMGFEPCYYNDSGIFRTGQDFPICNFNMTGYRLPTITEWQYAARGGLNSKRFTWGNDLNREFANYWKDNYNPRWDDGERPYTAPCASYPPNGYGLYDMAGNLLEWVWVDEVGLKNTGVNISNYAQDKKALIGVIGGAWNCSSFSLRTSYVYVCSPKEDLHTSSIGMRIVRKGFRPKESTD